MEGLKMSGKMLKAGLVSLAVLLPVLLAASPASSAQKVERAKVDVKPPATVLGYEFPRGSDIRIITEVTNTGEAVFGSDVAHIVFVKPNPEKKAKYLYYGWRLKGMYPDQTWTFKGPKIHLKYAGHYDVLAVVLRDEDGDGKFEYPDELISNKAKASFDVTGKYAAKVKIKTIKAVALGALGALAGALLGRRWL